MAKRFTDTEKWKRPNIRRLSPKMKLALFYLHDNCDHAGIWHADFELMGFQIGLEISESEFFAELGERVIRLEGEKLFVPSFIEFQYGELNPDVRAHASVIEVLRRNGLIDDEGKPFREVRKGLANPLATSQRVKDKDKDKDQDKDKERDKEPAPPPEGVKNFLADVPPAAFSAWELAFGAELVATELPMCRAGWESDLNRQSRGAKSVYIRNWLQNAKKARDALKGRTGPQNANLGAALAKYEADKLGTEAP